MSRSRWQILLGIATLGSIVLYFLVLSDYAPVRLSHSIGEGTSLETGGNIPENTEFFNWTTTTAFGPVSEEHAVHATIEELCESFPQNKLLHVQPVLKSGHGAMNRVRSQLNSSAACLTNLLIFSDLDEEIEGHTVVDTIKDIPQELIESDDQTLPYRHLKAFQANGTLEQSNETASQLPGWETDKFKFLPDVSRAWQMSPEKQWYVFFEGDTYIVWDNVFRLLENFDADQPHYFGSPSPGRDGIWFANGGPGFILSRAAVRKLVRDDYTKDGSYLGSRVSVKQWNETLVNCCGDSILGWALWEESLKLDGLWPMFNPHPPHGVPFSDLYWCQPVLTMHKPHEEDMQDLWRWEWQHRNATQRPVLYRDLAISYYNSFFETPIRLNWDNAEWDSFDPPESRAHTSPVTCQDACAAHQGCFQWTHYLGRCHFVRSFRFGRARDPPPLLEEGQDHDRPWSPDDRRFVSGWISSRIQKWMDERPCDQVQWVKPSTTRIF